VPLTILKTIFQIGATLLSIFEKSFAAHNNPQMVQNAVEKLHQDLKDKEVEIDKLAADPHATPEQHAAALDSIRLSAS
jgi:hypothetical protein